MMAANFPLGGLASHVSPGVAEDHPATWPTIGSRCRQDVNLVSHRLDAEDLMPTGEYLTPRDFVSLSIRTGDDEGFF
jgi:hypothetical protein